jgi:hypothetical protein
LLASEATRLAAGDAIRFVAAHPAQLRGRVEPIAVYVPETAPGPDAERTRASTLKPDIRNEGATRVHGFFIVATQPGLRARGIGAAPLPEPVH